MANNFDKLNFLTFEQKVLLAELVDELKAIGKKNYVDLICQSQLNPSIETLGTPEIKIAPGLQAEMQEAVNRIKHDVDPQYFKNISRIDVLMGGPYGQVTSDDPAVLKINLSRIKQEVKKQLDQRFQQENVKYDQNSPEHRDIFDEVLTRALIEVVAHEKGHVEDFSPKRGPHGEFLGGDFPGGEAPAESEAAKVKQITDQKHPLSI